MDDKLVLYANNNISPLWILSVFNFVFSAEINVPPSPCTQAVAVVPEVVKLLTFDQTCFANLEPNVYALSSYNVLSTILTNTGQSVKSTLNFTFTDTTDVITSTYFNARAPIEVNNSSARIKVTNITNISFNLEIHAPNKSQFLVYTVQYKDGQLFVLGSTGQNSLLGGAFLSPAPNIVPNIFAQIEASHDGQQICVLNFTVTEETRKRTYRQYCVPFTSVLCAPGCTLQAKLNALNAGNDFVQYMILRYILSALLDKKPFHRFDVNLLRQRYTEEFLQALAETEYRVFLPELTRYPAFATYFKC